MENQIGRSKLHSACDAYWQALINEVQNGFLGVHKAAGITWMWRQDKYWIDAGCPLIGNFNGDGKYPSPPEWWPVLTESQPPR